MAAGQGDLSLGAGVRARCSARRSCAMRAARTSRSGMKWSRCSRHTPRRDRLPRARRSTARAATLWRTGVPAMAEGVELGPYRILGPLDAGGMGEVYRALDTRLHREVAVKVLPAALSGDPERIARLEREARLLAALNHPHIATIHGLEIAAGVHAIIMELDRRADAGGSSLQRTAGARRGARDRAPDRRGAPGRARERHHPPRSQARQHQAHRHRRGEGARLRPRDGAAPDERDGAWRQPSTDAASRDGVVTGTPGYMSPEQARGERVDARSDVWAFGCVVYEMLTARPAFGRAPRPKRWRPSWSASPTGSACRRTCRSAFDACCADAWNEIPAGASITSPTHASRSRTPPATLNDRDLALATSSSRRRVRVLGASTAALALALAAALGAWLLRQPRGRAGAARGRDHHATDVRSVVFCALTRRAASRVRRRSRRAIHAVDAGRSTPRTRSALPGTERARRPFWSPDSRSIGFFRDSELKRIDARGGSAQTVTYASGWDNGRVGTGRNHPLLQHRFTRAAPCQCRRRERRVGDERQRRNRPDIAIRSSCREAGSSCFSSAVRMPCAAFTWARSNRRR